VNHFLSSFYPKKILNQRPASVLADTVHDFRPVIQSSVIGEIVQRSGSAPLGIMGAENNPGYPGVDNRSHAHDARLDGNIQGRA
jgi:hypothetical protein